MIKLSLFMASLVLLTAISSFATPLKINLTENDQARLTRELSRIDVAYRTDETIQESPYHIRRKTYRFLDESKAFFAKCSEDFIQLSTVGQNAQCEVAFDYDLSLPESLAAHDGFMPEFAIAEIKDPTLARVLFGTIGNGVSPKVFFNTQEQLPFTHPSTGEKFYSFRLRIDCERDATWRKFRCVVSAVK